MDCCTKCGRSKEVVEAECLVAEMRSRMVVMSQDMDRMRRWGIGVEPWLMMRQCFGVSSWSSQSLTVGKLRGMGTKVQRSRYGTVKSEGSSGRGRRVSIFFAVGCRVGSFASRFNCPLVPATQITAQHQEPRGT